MALDLESQGQLSLLERGAWQATIRVEPEHRLVLLCRSIRWDELMEKAKPILYDEQGIDPDIGRPLNLRAHLGAYILQTVHGWTDRWTEEMVRFYFPERLFCGYLDSAGSLDRTRIEDFRNRFGEKGAETTGADSVLGQHRHSGEGQDRKASGIWQKVGRQCVSWRICASYRAGKSETLRSRLCVGIAQSSPGIFRQSPGKLCHRSGHVGCSQSRTVPECRHQQDRHSAEGKRAGPGKSTGPPPTSKSPGRYRGSNSSLENSRLGQKSNEIRCGRSPSGYRSALSYNLTLLMRDLSLQNAFAGAIR